MKKLCDEQNQLPWLKPNIVYACTDITFFMFVMGVSNHLQHENVNYSINMNTKGYLAHQ